MDFHLNRVGMLKEHMLKTWSALLASMSFLLLGICSTSLAQQVDRGPLPAVVTPQDMSSDDIQPASYPPGFPGNLSDGKQPQWESQRGEQWQLQQGQEPADLADQIMEDYEDYFPEGEIEGIVIEGDGTERSIPLMNFLSNERYIDYRSDETMFSFMPGDGDQFGWFSFLSTPYISRGYQSGFNGVINIHLLSGPNSAPLPPRLYDFAIGYQRREELSDYLSYDVATSIGVYSDFEDSARDGVRMPSHAVGVAHWSTQTDLVLGVDYLARDDVKLLPVAGFSYRPFNNPSLRFDLIFPRPRIDYALSADRRLYTAMFLDGGSWDIEFPSGHNDVMTYRDYKLVLGYEHLYESGRTSSCEIGYAFDRQLTFRGLPGETNFDDAFVLRFISKR